LDTIDLSNLNRQFLFQRQHISKSKAHVRLCSFCFRCKSNLSVIWFRTKKVARETALQFNPDAKVFSYHANIKENQFDVEWFAGFALVLNALDNIGGNCRELDRLLLG
jgi:ubiquitin-like 1-activating enzyme E1 B